MVACHYSWNQEANYAALGMHRGEAFEQLPELAAQWFDETIVRMNGGEQAQQNNPLQFNGTYEMVTGIGDKAAFVFKTGDYQADMLWFQQGNMLFSLQLNLRNNPADTPMEQRKATFDMAKQLAQQVLARVN